MSIQNMTQKSAEAIRTAQATAMEYANQEVREEHLLVALLSAEEGLIPSLLRKMGVSAETVLREAGEAIDKLPKVSGMTADRVYYSRGFDAVPPFIMPQLKISPSLFFIFSSSIIL